MAEVRRDWSLEYDVDDVLRSQGADPDAIRERRPRLVALAQQALDQGRDLVEPAVLTQEVPVVDVRHRRVTLEGGVHLTGEAITEQLAGAEKVTVLLATIGATLGETAIAEAKTGLSYAFALDAVGSAAVHALSAAACNEIERSARESGLQTTLPLSPGMIGWGVDPGQRQIFSVIDPAEVGVVVSPTLEMRPLKSVTAVVGAGKAVATGGSICDYCGLRDTCRQRVA